MSATSICFGLLILVFDTLPLQRMHKKAETGGDSNHKGCAPSCC
jgi:hypothetical protein